MSVAYDYWSNSVVREARSTRCLTVGLMSGSRQKNDPRVTNRMANALVNQLRAADLDARLLLVRLDVFFVSRLSIGAYTQLGSTTNHRTGVTGYSGRSASQQSGQQLDPSAPELCESALGRWSFVDIPMPLSDTAAWNLERLPKWLRSWRKDFGVVLFDLGPLSLVPSRTIGRLCNFNYLLLGPEACGSHDWILSHVAWHEQSGSHIHGTLVTSGIATPAAA